MVSFVRCLRLVRNGVVSTSTLKQLNPTIHNHSFHRSIVSLSSNQKSVFKSLEPIKEEMAKKKFYAVVRGRVPGIYVSWDDCAEQVLNFQDNLYKGFKTEQEATTYMNQHGIESTTVIPGAFIQEATVSANDDDQLIDLTSEDVQLRPSKKRKQPSPTDTIGNNMTMKNTFNNKLIAETEQHIHDTSTEIDTSSLNRVRIEFDGASKRNPGPAGFGAVLYNDETGKELCRVYHYMGDYHTNNQAEYAGLIAGLQAARDMGVDNVVIQGDSMLVVNQVSGKWQIKNEGLQPYHAKARGLLRGFTRFEARQVPRAENSVADVLSNQAIDEWNRGLLKDAWIL